LTRQQPTLVSLQQASRLVTAAGQVSPSTLAYPYHVSGPLDVPALRDAMREVVRRHAILRTIFPDGPTPEARVIEAEDVEVPLTVLPVGSLHREDIYDYIAAETKKGVNIRTGPTFRGVVLAMAPERHVVVFIVDHIIYDGVTNSRVQTELAALYAARVSGRPEWTRFAGELPPTYEEFCAEQVRQLNGAWGEQARDFWSEQFSVFGHYPPICRASESPDVPDKAPATDLTKFHRVVRPVPPQISARVRQSARRASATPFAAWIAHILQVMDRLGVPVRGLVTDVSGRIWPGYDTTVGLFSHGFPVYADIPARMPEEKAVATIFDSLEAASRWAMPLRQLSRDWVTKHADSEMVVRGRPFLHFLDETIWRFNRSFGNVRFTYFESHGPFAHRLVGTEMFDIKLEPLERDLYLTIQADTRVNDPAMMEAVADQLLQVV
jgi:hypothetical protein